MTAAYVCRGGEEATEFRDYLYMIFDIIFSVTVVLVVLVLAGLPCLGSRGECLSECFQRKDDFGECQKTELVHISSQLSSSEQV